MSKLDLVQKGSQTAKNGFQNEQNICDKFNNWRNDNDAKQWLIIMQYNLSKIDYVKACIIHGYKSDINVQVQIKLKSAVDIENIQVKLVSNKNGFNQIDKRWLSNYRKMWNIPGNIYKLLQYYTGEIKPYRDNIRDMRRMFIDEFTKDEQKSLLDWISINKTLILSDIIKGRGQFSAEWVLVVQKFDNNVRWTLVNINRVLQHYSNGNVRISPKGSIYIGNVTMQRKGGDGGRDTANMLQFKLNPAELFCIENIILREE